MRQDVASELIDFVQFQYHDILVTRLVRLMKCKETAILSWPHAKYTQRAEPLLSLQLPRNGEKAY